MTTPRNDGVRWLAIIAGATALMAAGAGTTYLLLSPAAEPAALSEPTAGSAPPADLAAPPADVRVTLTPEAVKRAGIITTIVDSFAGAGSQPVPAVVEANAYRRVVVTPLVAGRITRVMAELGQTVETGETIAQIFSPELADAQTRYASARAAFVAIEQELERTGTLAAIGAASQQELEQVRAAHAGQRAGLQSLEAELELLGVSASARRALRDGTPAGPIADVPAPMAGVVTERLANTGLNVNQSSALFTIVDLSTVWVVADVFERQLGAIRVGQPVSMTTVAAPGEVRRGRVDYIDPQLSAATRTAKVRIEVPNPGHTLRLGMYAEVAFADEGGDTLAVPRSAVQQVGDRTVVYVAAGPAGSAQFIEREVRLGDSHGPRVAVLSGLSPGDTVVAEGSFAVRAEIERRGLRRPARQASAVTILVGEQGFDPATVTLQAGVPARLTFLRTTDQTCATTVEFPSLKISRALPLNEPVSIDITPAATVDIGFICGMQMLRGTIVVTPSD